MGIDALKRAVFLDRDGVITAVTIRDGVTRPPADAEAVEVIAGVAPALDLLAAHDLLRIVVTNQPDVARGLQTRAGVDAINDRLLRDLALDAVFTCYHDDPDRCACRKPKPGLLFEAARRFDIDLGASFMVGDRASDIGAGRAAGCQTFLVHSSVPIEPCEPDYNVAGLFDAARKIVELVDVSDGEGRLE